MEHSNKGAVTQTIKAIFLDDDPESRWLEKQKFLSQHIDVYTPGDIQQFINLNHAYPIILSDLDLTSFKKGSSGITVLLDIRKNNKVSFVAIYSAFVSRIIPEEQKLLDNNNIRIYSKLDSLDIKNLKKDYLKWRNSPEQYEEASFMEQHYSLNKHIVLQHLKQMSETTTKIPIISKKKLLSRAEIIEEIKNNTELGHAFILEFIQAIARLKGI